MKWLSLLVGVVTAAGVIADPIPDPVPDPVADPVAEPQRAQKNNAAKNKSSRRPASGSNLQKRDGDWSGESFWPRRTVYSWGNNWYNNGNFGYRVRPYNSWGSSWVRPLWYSRP